VCCSVRFCESTTSARVVLVGERCGARTCEPRRESMGRERAIDGGNSAELWQASGMVVEELAQNLALGSLLEDVRRRLGGYEILDHWQQGEFHHDLLLKVNPRDQLPGSVLVVATNCNGGVKEVLCFAERPERGGLWRQRCPDNPEFRGELPTVLAGARTIHWFDPCELLEPGARSEYKPEYRERQEGGGWRPKCKG
jgi:hypothetical protein